MKNSAFWLNASLSGIWIEHIPHFNSWCLLMSSVIFTNSPFYSSRIQNGYNVNPFLLSSTFTILNMGSTTFPHPLWTSFIDWRSTWRLNEIRQREVTAKSMSSNLGTSFSDDFQNSAENLVCAALLVFSSNLRISS